MNILFVVSSIFVLFGLFAIYLLGQKLRKNYKFYQNNKGTLFGKIVFSPLFTIVVFLPILWLKLDIWINLILLQIIGLAIITDLFANIFGKKLSKLPDNLQFIRLRYPMWISGNKSFTANIITLLVILTINYFFINIDYIVIIYVIIGTVIGDSWFSVFKRIQKIDDYFATLGPIGGLCDRIDGWIFAILFYSFI